MNHLRDVPKRLLVGRPMQSERMGETLLPKRIALPVFCSDPLSSNAYATEEIMLMLSVGGLGLLHFVPWIAAAVAMLLVVVVASYRQTCRAYPGGGGAYAVSRANLGPKVALVAAAALLVDYVLTVAVSVAAGVANIISAIPSLAPHAVTLSLVLIGLLAVMNLRGTRESGTFFAIPTYAFIGAMFTMIALGGYQFLAGQPPVAESASIGIQAPAELGPLLLLAIVLRSFASGCTALTGVEAVSNGVPSFKEPKSHNAAATLAIMGGITVAMLIGIATLALATQVHVAADAAQLTGAPAGYVQKTVIAQLAGAVFGPGSIGFFTVQVVTAAVLVLAANTAFNGFPILASILGRDGYLPRQFARRGDRLVFSNGVVILAVLASALIVAFNASTTHLIQLYIIGVFVSFTLSQAGMVRHWTHLLAVSASTRARGTMQRSRAINTLGACVTSLVLVIVLATKFTHGAYIVVIAIPVMVAVMLWVKGHYDRVALEQVPSVDGVALPSRVHAFVLVSGLTTPALRALAYARATRPSTLVALTVRTNPVETAQLIDEWNARGIPVPLTVLDSPFRDITRPALEHIARLRKESPRDVVAVFIPEYIVEHWWEQALHNQSALRLKAALLFQPGVMVTSVPWRFHPLEAPSAPVDRGRTAAFGGSIGSDGSNAPGAPPSPAQVVAQVVARGTAPVVADPARRPPVRR
ncbi:MAG: APC family permease [Cellulomonas sp.]|nr:APC family permease [Cellulomonas sp.]